MRVRNKWEIEWQQSCQTFNLSASFPAVMMWCAIISKYNFRLCISIPQNYLLFLIHSKAKIWGRNAKNIFFKFFFHSLRLLSFKKYTHKILIFNLRVKQPVYCVLCLECTFFRFYPSVYTTLRSSKNYAIWVSACCAKYACNDVRSIKTYFSFALFSWPFISWCTHSDLKSDNKRCVHYM